ncbi:BatA domain-containing protein [Spongiivirga sp. MCCC 1A20706]|uniref:BatA domain-containing protein n=1 Tax=Spongiivirga sp. MCCC 1A20706 TaxID=3160963 RepID=UPI0039773C05
MQFKNPDLLYALFLLIIPIIVHLFQLRRFQKVPFTNVQFLKEVTSQTRKSSQLKKWLVLTTRLLAMALLIFAFAQPFIANSLSTTNAKNQVIYLDNSFSMQAKGANGPLYDQAVQELLRNIPEEEIFTLFTNTDTYRDVSIKDIRDQLLSRKFSSSQLDYNNVVSKGKTLVNRSTQKDNNLILISDFQEKDKNFDVANDSLNPMSLVLLEPVNTNNLAIDTVFVKGVSSNSYTLAVKVINQGDAIENIPVSLFDADKLLAKTAVSIGNNDTAITEFSIPNNKNIKGKISLEDTNISFDNELFFSINEPMKIKVLAINQADDNFLKRIFTADEFTLLSTDLDQLNYNVITDQNLIVLNELDLIPNSLTTAINQFIKDGGKIIVIPSANINLTNYNNFLEQISPIEFESFYRQSRKLTTIAFDHPFMNSIFDKKVTNFQYPTINTHYKLSTNNALLSLDNKNAFLTTLGNSGYLFTAGLNSENGNFKNAPLIAPIFYKMGKQSLQLSDLYYTIGKNNNYDVLTTISQDQIVNLERQNETMIPLQRVFTNKVSITTTAQPSVAGIYQLTNRRTPLQDVSYNYDRAESLLRYVDIDENQFTVSNSVTEALQEIQNKYEVNSLWKWFAIFAAFCLLLEMIILKYFK